MSLIHPGQRQDHIQMQAFFRNSCSSPVHQSKLLLRHKTRLCHFCIALMVTHKLRLCLHPYRVFRVQSLHLPQARFGSALSTIHPILNYSPLTPADYISSTRYSRGPVRTTASSRSCSSVNTGSHRGGISRRSL